MNKLQKMALLLAAASVCVAPGPFAQRAAAEKIGVLVIGAGTNETYKPDWIQGYTGHFFPIFMPGMLAGGTFEGGTCYSLIHYANEIEAAVCSNVRGEPVPEGTPIDIFCNEYTDTARYPVRSMLDEPLLGAGGYLSTCYPGIIPYFIATGHSTTDPATGEVIIGPHVTDPDGPGIGIADFMEMYAFEYMAYHYKFRESGYRCPFRKQFLRFVYGNDIPAVYGGYAPDAVELSNIKDAVAQALDNDTTVVYRMGWEAYMHNRDMYGDPAFIADSTETALQELIEDEQVDRIVVFANGGHHSNITNWGYCWRDSDGRGVSSVDNATYCGCINDLSDGRGPDTRRKLVQLLSKKPWRQFESTYPIIHDIARELKPELPVTYANASGEYPAFDQAIVELLKYTVAKYGIAPSASLKVILATHGYSNGYMDSALCDSYFQKSDELVERVAVPVRDYLAAAWSGKYEVAHGDNEFAEPSEEGTADDAPDWRNPLGIKMSTGEQIDVAINGRYINGLGSVVDNGNDNFDYIIVLPLTWDAENVDTIEDFRGLTLGNHELVSAGGGNFWLRQTHDADGHEYRMGEDFDSEFFTVKVMDGSGWESTPARTGLRKPAPIGKGSPEKPTTVILTGAILSQGNGPIRGNFIAACAASILDAIANPDLGGYQDEACREQALGMVTGFSARRLFRSVRLAWTAVGESRADEFALYRAPAEGGPYEQLDLSLLRTVKMPDGASQYRYRDLPPQAGTPWYYRLERARDGAVAAYGPVEAAL